MNTRNHTMHPAKALQTAVFAVTEAHCLNSAHIRGTDITVRMSGASWYIVENGSTMYTRRNRQQAIDTIKQILTGN